MIIFHTHIYQFRDPTPKSINKKNAQSRSRTRNKASEFNSKTKRVKDVKRPKKRFRIIVKMWRIRDSLFSPCSFSSSFKIN